MLSTKVFAVYGRARGLWWATWKEQTENLYGNWLEKRLFF